MEYNRSSHVEEEEEDDLDEEEEEYDDHHYTTAPAAPVGAPLQQLVPGQHHGPVGSRSSMMDSAAAAFSRPFLPPNSSLVSQVPLPPGFLQAHRQHQQAHPRRRERAVGTQHRQLWREQARNGATRLPVSTLAVTTGGVAMGAEPTQCRYRECQRNHAAKMGAHVLDGCGEFMPSAYEGPGFLACAACGCHRSFHRREAVQGVAAAAALSPIVAATPNANSSGRVIPLLLAPPRMQTRPHVPASPSSAPASLTESSSEELRGPAPARPHPPAPTSMHQLTVGSASAPPAPSKKRFRTKFTAEQKDRMREFAHRVGWRIHKPDSEAVDVFCAQVGVSRRVLQVWMHNNKHLAKITPQSTSSQQPTPTPQPPPPPPPQQHRHQDDQHYPLLPPPHQQKQPQND